MVSKLTAFAAHFCFFLKICALYTKKLDYKSTVMQLCGRVDTSYSMRICRTIHSNSDLSLISKYGGIIKITLIFSSM